MNKLKYLLRCIKKININNMFKIIAKINQKTGKSKIFLFFDIIYCGLKYGAGYYDYQEFEFYLLKNKERKTYLTRVKNNYIIKKYNDSSAFYKFDNKGIFNDLFKTYLHRDYLIIDQNSYNKYLVFIKKHPIFIVKPIDGNGGKGVQKIDIKENKDLSKLFNELLLRKQILLEEYIIQNKEINKLSPSSVNTLRLFTFYDNKNVYVLNSVFKIGNGGVTDNFSSGSMYTFLDDNGQVMIPAIDKDDHVFIIHPLTKTKIVGFKVPYYKEAINLVKECSKIVPNVRYIGWDVAITNDGPVIIEGNCYPGIFQMKPSLSNTHEGLISKYQKYLDLK